MASLPPARSSLSFALHLGGAGLFALLFAWMVYERFVTPFDLFVHRGYLSEELLRFGVNGAVFYGFSLVLLRSCPPPRAWGALYAASSWLLFVIAFFPTAPFGSSGMMRRIANPTEYEASRSAFEQNLRLTHGLILFTFALIQAFFLRWISRQMNARRSPPNVPA